MWSIPQREEANGSPWVMPSVGTQFVWVVVLLKPLCMTLCDFAWRGSNTVHEMEPLYQVQKSSVIALQRLMPIKSCIWNWTENVMFAQFPPVWLFFLKHVNKCIRFKDSVEQAHTWGLKWVRLNEWTKFCWLQQGVRSGRRVHVTPTPKSIFKVFAKVLKCHHFMKNFNLFFTVIEL